MLKTSRGLFENLIKIVTSVSQKTHTSISHVTYSWGIAQFPGLECRLGIPALGTGTKKQRGEVNKDLKQICFSKMEKSDKVSTQKKCGCL